MKIEIWSDVACPWCFVGKRRFEAALREFAHRDEVEIIWRSYQLDPGLPDHYDGSELEYLSSRKGLPADQVEGMFRHVAGQGLDEGLNFAFDQVVVANSFTAHRLIHLAAAHGKQGQAKERLLSGHFEHGKDIGSRGYLTEVATELGIGAAEVEELFSTDKYAAQVNADISEARGLGISGVPFFVIDRKYGLSGAQPVETFAAALHQAWQESRPLVMMGAGPGASDDGQGCGPDGCSSLAPAAGHSPSRGNPGQYLASGAGDFAGTEG